jgi:ATP-binding cassette subfamily B protein
VLATASVVSFNAEIGTVFLVLSFTTNMTIRLWDFAQRTLRNVNKALGDAEEATEMLYRTPLITDPTNPERLPRDKGIIAIKNMSFAHDKLPLFENISLTIQQGEKIGLVGHSGSGKTTLTKLLLRFKDVNDGTIEINGVDIRKVTQNDLRDVIAYVPQEPLLFHRSLAENIAYGKLHATKNEIISAAKKAHAHTFIEQLAEGYDTLVGERGVKLSGGQKQRIAIARAMLKDAPILLLDEATSALDSESELAIQDALWKLMKDKTAIVIAHRLSTIQKMDRIIVLENGKIIEEGTHTQLLKKKGHYAKLWQHQSGGFLQE